MSKYRINIFFAPFLLLLILLFPAMDAAAFDHDWNVTAADLDGNHKDDVIVNFGAYGVWAWMNNSNWTQLHSLTSKALVAGDLDGNGKSDLAIDFAPYGLWLFMNNQTWVKLHDAPTNYIVASDADYDGKTDLFISFPSGGVWIWANNFKWIKLHDLSANGIAVGQLDGKSLKDIVLNFGSNGIWIWMNNTTWDGSFQNFKATFEMTTWTDNPDLADQLLLNIFNLGVNSYYMSSTGFVFGKNNHPISPVLLKTADLDGNGIAEVIYDFSNPYGVWSATSLGAWAKLHDLSASDLAAADMDGNGQKDLILDFKQYGLWAFINNHSWVQLHPGSPTLSNTAPQGSGLLPRKDICVVKLNAPTFPFSRPGELITVQVTSTYTCNSPTYSLTNPPPGMSINPLRGLIQWIVPLNPGGTYQFSINAYDGQGGSDSLPMSLTWQNTQ